MDIVATCNICLINGYRSKWAHYFWGVLIHFLLFISFSTSAQELFSAKLIETDKQKIKINSHLELSSLSQLGDIQAGFFYIDQEKSRSTPVYAFRAKLINSKQRIQAWQIEKTFLGKTALEKALKEQSKFIFILASTNNVVSKNNRKSNRNDFLNDRFTKLRAEVNPQQVWHYQLASFKDLDLLCFSLQAKFGQYKIDFNSNEGLSLDRGFYLKHKKSGDREISDALSFQENSYIKNLENEKEESESSSKALEKFEDRGGRWTKGIDDYSLRQIFIQHGLETEIKRRDRIFNEKSSHEFKITYAQNLQSFTLSERTDTYANSIGYNLSFAYNLFLEKISPFDDLSLEFVIDRGLNYYNLGPSNAKSEEGSYGIILNYSLINRPATLKSIIWDIGVGLKFGAAYMSGENLAASYQYQMFHLPILRSQLKYRFRVGDLNAETIKVGMALFLGYELSYREFHLKDKNQDAIAGQFKIKNAQFVLGSSFYF